MLLPSIIIALIVFIIDQSTKFLVLPSVDSGHAIEVLSFLNFDLAHNYGAAFGILAQESGWQRWLFVLVAIFVSIVILVWSKRLTRKDWWTAIALGMILGGAWGNMLDRVRYGRVIDFIDFHIGTWHWYMFNIADVGICLGAALLLLFSVTAKEASN